MCGQILHKCGLIHLGASCLAAFQFTQARAIETKCDTKNKFTVRNYLDIFFLIYKRLNLILYTYFFLQPIQSHTKKPSNYKNGFECSVGTPYGNQVTYTKRLFVASEVDDTHIYHIHTEIMVLLKKK